MRTLRGRTLAVAAALLITILYLLPTFVELPGWWGKIFPVSRIRLGLDLQGGLYLTLEVKVDEAVTTRVDQSAEALRLALAREGVEGAAAVRDGIEAIRIILPPSADPQRARQIVADTLPDFTLTTPPGRKGPWKATLKAEVAAHIREGAVEQALATLRSRIDQYGVTEPTVQRQGERRIVLQLPGVQRPEEVQRLIGTTARLEFKEIDDTSNLLQPLLTSLPPGITLKNDEIKFSDKKKKKPLTPPYLVSTDLEKLKAYVAGRLPPTHQILIGEEPEGAGGKKAYRTYLVKSPTLMTGEGVVNARVRFAYATNVPVVVFEFDEASAKRFADLTESLKGRRMAVIVDGFVRSAPLIEQRIAGGRAQIAGRMNDREAKDLAIMLRTGALRASVVQVAQRSVGPSLGRDSVMSGFVATLVGLAIVLVFMVVYYRTSGLFADAALLFNLALVLAALAAFDATLTLPGIAGLALTVGMSVDANVLIFERIREEVRLGKTFRAAVEAGFDRAYRTIIDANATTLLAALILYYYGVGPVRGFAVTLSLGIGGTLFTSLIFTRLLFHLALGSRGPKRVAI
jgi:protein-export membrane protein SecD